MPSIIKHYPKVRRDPAIVETMFGTKVADPYRWLEDPKSTETQQFVASQNQLAADFIGRFPARDQLKQHLTEAYNYGKFGCPFKRGSHMYFFYNSGLQGQSVLYRTTLDALSAGLSLAKSAVFFDPNKLRDDGTASLSSYSFSNSGKMFAYGVSYSGSDWVEISLMDAASMKPMADKLKWVKFSGIQWTHDEKGFFYLQYPAPVVDDAGTETESNTCPKLLYHTIDEEQSKDEVIFEDKSNPTHMFGTSVSDDGRYLIMNISNSCDPINKLYIMDLTQKERKFVKVVDEFKAAFSYITNEGSVFILKTNLNASKYKVVTVDLAGDLTKFVDLIPESESVLDNIDCVAENHLVTVYMKDCRNTVSIYSTKGDFEKELPVDIGSLDSLSSRREDVFFFFKMSSFLNPGVVYHYDFNTASMKQFLETKVNIAGYKSEDFVQQQVFYSSSDGTKIPMFLVGAKNSVAAGKNKETPTYLYGYGGFNISLTPMFSPQWLVFIMKFGGILAIANIRGGGEYGDKWHKAGCEHNKQQCFDDFQHAAKYLAEQEYSSSRKIAINGGSNGGLLVAACVNQRPDLFGCAIAEVGVLDMLRFHKFTIGHAWRSDYGDPDKEDDFKVLIKYSPYHNVSKEKEYPAVLLLTSDHDDRVVPLHSFKYISELQYHRGDKNSQPLLIRIDTKAGHGAGKPTSKRVSNDCLFELLIKYFIFIYYYLIVCCRLTKLLIDCRTWPWRWI